jgi:hypothetical protein
VSLEGDRVMNSKVLEPHQRKGLATAMYQMAEKELKGKKLNPDVSVSQSKDAKALWSQPKRPFGKK